MLPPGAPLASIEGQTLSLSLKVQDYGIRLPDATPLLVLVNAETRSAAEVLAPQCANAAAARSSGASPLERGSRTTIACTPVLFSWGFCADIWRHNLRAGIVIPDGCAGHGHCGLTEGAQFSSHAAERLLPVA